MASERSTSLLPGFGVLLGKEWEEAQRSKRMIAFLAVMTLSVALIPIVGYINIESATSATRHQISAGAMETLLGGWASLVGYLGALMVIAATVDALAHERSLGIASWIITKPVSRMSYLAAKATAHALTASLALVILPTVVFLVLMLMLYRDVPVANVFGAAAVLSIQMAFLSFFVVAIGVPLKTVTPVALVALALWFLPNFVPAIESLQWTWRVLPSYLPIAAFAAAVGENTSSALTIPAVSVAFAAAVFGLAVIMFERQEL